MSANSGKEAHYFPHKTGDVVLVKWRDGKIYFAKIKTIEWSKKRCVVIFDDKSQDLARFSWIHDVNETTSDIICVKCKQDYSDKGNEIVLCDQCGYGYHQKCHETKILQRALEDDSSWICYFCEQEMACPYVTNADMLTQSLEDIDDQASKPDKFKRKKRKQSMKLTAEVNKKYSTGLLADLPTVEHCGEEEAIGEHYTEESMSLTPKSQKTQSRRKSKPYKVEICSSVSKEYFVDDEEDVDTPTSSHGRKIKRKNAFQEAGGASKKSCTESPVVTESPSGVGIFSFDMPTEFHSNLHQLAMASQLVSQSPSGEVPRSVIKAIEYEQKNHQIHSKSPVTHDKPTSLVLSIPRSPLISVSRKLPGTSETPVASSSHPLETSTPSCTAIPSPVIVSHCNGKVTSPIETPAISTPAISTPAISTPAVLVPGSPESGESVFTYTNSSIAAVTTTTTEICSTSATPTIVRVDSGSDAVFTSHNASATSIETPVKTHIIATSVNKPPNTVPTSVHHVTTPVLQGDAVFECPPPVTIVTKPTSLQFVDKNVTSHVRASMPPKFSGETHVFVTTSHPSVTTPTVTAASPTVVHTPLPAMIRAPPTPVTSQPVYYVQINGGTPSQPVLVRPIRQQQAQPSVVKVIDGSAPHRSSSSSHGDQRVSYSNAVRSQKPTGHMKETHTVLFANQVKDMGTNISVKMGPTYNMVSEYTLISKFEEAWNKLNELTSEWQHPKQSVAKAAAATSRKSSVSSNGKDKVIVVTQQPQQIQQRMPVQLVPISNPQHATTPVVHADVLSSPAHVISSPVVIPAVAANGAPADGNYSYYKANMNSVNVVHPHKNKDEVYMVQVVKPVAPVMPVNVAPVVPVRSNEKRTAQQCDVCSKKASFLCSGCQSAWYCGRGCQYTAWQEHSHRCSNKRL